MECVRVMIVEHGCAGRRLARAEVHTACSTQQVCYKDKGSKDKDSRYVNQGSLCQCKTGERGRGKFIWQ